VRVHQQTKEVDQSQTRRDGTRGAREIYAFSIGSADA
jgi:hypothetical protein